MNDSVWNFLQRPADFDFSLRFSENQLVLRVKARQGTWYSARLKLSDVITASTLQFPGTFLILSFTRLSVDGKVWVWLLPGFEFLAIEHEYEALFEARKSKRRIWVSRVPPPPSIYHPLHHPSVSPIDNGIQGPRQCFIASIKWYSWKWTKLIA